MKRNINLDEELKVCEEHSRQGYHKPSDLQVVVVQWGVCRMCGVRQFIKKLMNGEIEHNEKKHAAFRRIAEGLE